MKNKIDSFF